MGLSKGGGQSTRSKYLELPKDAFLTTTDITKEERKSRGNKENEKKSL